MSRPVPPNVRVEGPRWRLISGRKLTSSAVLLAVVLLAGWAIVGWRDASSEDLAAIRSAIGERRFDEAGAGLLRRLRRSPSDESARLMLGGLRLIEGRDEEARVLFEAIRGPGAAWSQAQNQLAEIWIRRRRAAEAERILVEVVAADPSNAEARRRLVYLLNLEARDDEARVVLRELYRLAPDRRHLVMMTGLAMDEGRNRQQGGELDEYLARTPEDPLLLRARGLASLRLGRPAEARPDLEASAKGIEDDPSGRSALAECLLEIGKLDGSQAALGAEPSRPIDRARWWVVRGRLEEARGRSGPALDAYREALRARPDDRKALYRLGQALVRLGRAEEGRPLLARAEEVRLRDLTIVLEMDRCLRGALDAELFEKIAGLCQQAGLAFEARGWYQQAVGLDPTRPSAQAGLAADSGPTEPPALALRRKSTPSMVAGAEASSAPVPGRHVRFEDVAEKWGLAYRYNAWPSGNLFLGDTMGGGVGLIDYDEDGWLDVYFVDGCRLPIQPGEDPSPNKLFRNRRDGTFEDVTDRAGVGGHGYGMGCAVGDYDNDGHDDLYVTGLGRAILYRNRGNGTFEDVTERARVGSDRWSTAAGFGDLDGDGDLDLVVVTYVEADPRKVPECLDPTGRPFHCPPGQFQPQFDHLFRNEGDGTFKDVSHEAGQEVPGGLGLGLAIADLDEDGRLDLFVANDAAPNFFFRNLGDLKFEELGATSGLAYNASGQATASMGVVAEDLDGDSRIDLFHVNFLNEANTLARNLGGGLFDDIVASSGLDATGRTTTGFGAVALDIENDGRLDLFVANGHVDDRPWADHPMAQRPTLYRSKAPGRFELVPTEASPYLGRKVVGRGAAAGDLDNDGRVDVVVVHRDAPAAVLRNVTEGGHWFGLRLVGEGVGKTPVGARVTCEAGGRRTTRWLSSGTSYLASNDPRLWFGLGTNSTVDRLDIRWPSGREQSWSGLAVDRLWLIREGHDPSPDDRLLRR